jgi:hypothetical protein
MRPNLLLFLLAASASTSCAGLGGTDGEAVVVVHAVEHGQPAQGLVVFALADDSQHLGSSTTDAAGEARITVSRAGAMWLAANAGLGHGFVTRVTVQAHGTTDVGERAVTLLDEQPAVFELKGVGYEERVTELDGQLADFALLHGVIVSANVLWGPEKDQWGISVLHDRLVETSLDTGLSRVIAEVTGGAQYYISAIGDGRYLQASLFDFDSTWTLQYYDSVTHTFVFQLPSLPVSAGNYSALAHLVGDVLTVPFWRTDTATGQSVLLVSQFDTSTGNSSEMVVWSDLQINGQPATIAPGVVSIYGNRIIAMATVTACSDASCQGSWVAERRIAVFDAKTLDRLGGFTIASDTIVTGPDPTGTVVFGLRGAADLDVVRIDVVTGESQALGTVAAGGCGIPSLTSPQLAGPLLLGVTVPTRCDDLDANASWQRIAALFGGDDSASLTALPVTGLPEVHGAFSLLAEPKAGSPMVVNVAGDPSGLRLQVWGLHGTSWALDWQSEPGESAGLASGPAAPLFAYATLPDGAGTQLFVLGMLAGASTPGPSRCHTWARLTRGSRVAFSQSGFFWYEMADPLTGRMQIFQDAICNEVAP